MKNLFTLLLAMMLALCSTAQTSFTPDLVGWPADFLTFCNKVSYTTSKAQVNANYTISRTVRNGVTTTDQRIVFSLAPRSSYTNTVLGSEYLTEYLIGGYTKADNVYTAYSPIRTFTHDGKTFTNPAVTHIWTDNVTSWQFKSWAEDLTFFSSIPREWANWTADQIKAKIGAQTLVITGERVPYNGGFLDYRTMTYTVTPERVIADVSKVNRNIKTPADLWNYISAQSTYVDGQPNQLLSCLPYMKLNQDNSVDLTIFMGVGGVNGGYPVPVEQLNLSTIRNAANNGGISPTLEVRVLNGCTSFAQTDANAIAGNGLMGQCTLRYFDFRTFRKMRLVPVPGATATISDTGVITYDPTKPLIIRTVVQESSSSTKSAAYECYLNTTTGKCSQSYPVVLKR